MKVYWHRKHWPQLRASLRVREQVAQNRRLMMSYRLPADAVCVSLAPGRARRQWNERFMGCPEWGSSLKGTVARAGAGTAADNLLFMHARRSAGGNARLVAVCAGACWTSTLQLHAVVLTPQQIDAHYMYGTYGGAAPRRDGVAGRFELPVDPHASVAIFAGQPDPRDRSRFIIPFRSGGRRGTIDGRLRDDGGVELAVTMDGAAAVPLSRKE